MPAIDRAPATERLTPDSETSAAAPLAAAKISDSASDPETTEPMPDSTSAAAPRARPKMSDTTLDVSDASAPAPRLAGGRWRP